MRILHCCLSCFYIDDYNYQENVLPRQNKEDGHDVLILASTETFIDNNIIGYVSPSIYINEDGIKVIRIPYRSFLPGFVMRKIRAYKDVYRHIDDFKPDVILFHGTAAYEILNVAKYKKLHPEIKLYVDSHEDSRNSARGFVSREILHKLFYKKLLHRALPSIDKILCVTSECYDFVRNLYKIPDLHLEIYPLGGKVIKGTKYDITRKLTRMELSLAETDTLFVHSGKMNKDKRTEDLLKAFIAVPNSKFILVLIGSISEDIEASTRLLIERDSRIAFLGWKKPDELRNYLCAADLYLQPGSQSATMQNAVCCGCPVMLYPHKSHLYLLKDSPFYVETIQDMQNVFEEIAENSSILVRKKSQSNKIAQEVLDYRVLAARLYK